MNLTSRSCFSEHSHITAAVTSTQLAIMPSCSSSLSWPNSGRNLQASAADWVRHASSACAGFARDSVGGVSSDVG